MPLSVLTHGPDASSYKLFCSQWFRADPGRRMYQRSNSWFVSLCEDGETCRGPTYRNGIQCLCLEFHTAFTSSLMIELNTDGYQWSEPGSSRAACRRDIGGQSLLPQGYGTCKGGIPEALASRTIHNTSSWSNAYGMFGVAKDMNACRNYNWRCVRGETILVGAQQFWSSDIGISLLPYNSMRRTT